MILIPDVETSDLPKKGFPMDDPSQPWVKQVACMLTEMDGVTVWGRLQAVIAPEGRKGRPGAEEVHGITDHQSARYGVREIPVLGLMTEWMRKVKFVVGYGIEFDQIVVEGVILRRGKDASAWKRPGVKWICLREKCIDLCKVPSEHESGTYRWPNLDKACEVVLGEAPREGHHDAWDDMQRTHRLMLELMRRGILKFEDE